MRVAFEESAVSEKNQLQNCNVFCSLLTPVVNRNGDNPEVNNSNGYNSSLVLYGLWVNGYLLMP